MQTKNADKAFDRIQLQFLIKTTHQTGNIREFSQPGIKVSNINPKLILYYKYLTVLTELFLVRSKSGTKQEYPFLLLYSFRISLLTTAFYICSYPLF